MLCANHMFSSKFEQIRDGSDGQLRISDARLAGGLVVCLRHLRTGSGGSIGKFLRLFIRTQGDVLFIEPTDSRTASNVAATQHLHGGQNNFLVNHDELKLIVVPSLCWTM